MATGARGENSVRVAFQGQVEAIRLRLERQVPTASWTDLMRSAHDRAFVVAGAMEADLLADFAGAVDEAIREGRSIDWFREQFDEIVDRHGWAYRGERNWRSRVIYTTNMRSSYAAGRLAQLRDPALQEVAPYWMYRHGGSADPRPDHLSWDKLVLPADDPWWQEHYPPNGWGCKCYVVAVSEDQARRLGGRFEPPPEDPPGAIDAGWDYMPGDTVADDLRRTLEGKTRVLPARLGAALWEDAPALVKSVQADAFASWVDEVTSTMEARGRAVQVGAFSTAVVAALAERAVTPASAALVVRDRDTVHTYRGAKSEQIPLEWYRELPRHLPEYQAALLERRAGGTSVLLIYPDPSEPEGAYKLVVQVDYVIKVTDEGTRHKGPANIVQTGRRLHVQDIRKDVSAGNLEMLDGSL